MIESNRKAVEAMVSAWFAGAVLWFVLAHSVSLYADLRDVGARIDALQQRVESVAGPLP